MPSTILVLCAFLALLAAAVWPAVRHRGAPGQRFRAVLAATTVLLLLVLMLVTTAPRDVTDDGRRYTCIEEPLGGLNPLSSDATDAPLEGANRLALHCSGWSDQALKELRNLGSSGR